MPICKFIALLYRENEELLAKFYPIIVDFGPLVG
jgi:hypothetical protein